MSTSAFLIQNSGGKGLDLPGKATTTWAKGFNISNQLRSRDEDGLKIIEMLRHANAVVGGKLRSLRDQVKCMLGKPHKSF